jgi:hypothetical protein
MDRSENERETVLKSSRVCYAHLAYYGDLLAQRERRAVKTKNVSSTFLNLPFALMQLIRLEMCSMLRVETADT